MKNFLLALGIITSQSLLAQSPYLLKDVNQLGASSNPQNTVTIGTVAYFYADDGTHGRELWRTDGKPTGTYMLKDINPGKGNGFEKHSEYDQFTQLINVAGVLYFIASDGVHGYELWKSDGTKSGTMMVKDINPIGVSRIRDLTVFNGKLLFSAQDELEEEELWISDGTEAGTVMVEGKNAIYDGSRYPRDITVFNNAAYYRGYDNSGVTKLWKYDGSTTSAVYTVDASKLTASETTLFFVGDDPIHGPELWQTDGTESGTAMLKDVYQGNDVVTPQALITINNTLFFVHRHHELWKSDGTEAGTVLVKDLRPDDEISFGEPSNLVALGTTLYFFGLDDTYNWRLWKSDGTEEGTTKIDLEGNPYPSHLSVVGSSLYFTTYNALWKSSGTANSTTKIKNVSKEGFWGSISHLFNMNGTLLMAADNGMDGNELWKSDGTSAGTVMVKDINSKGAGDTYSPLVHNGNQVAFGTGEYSLQLWLTDGKQTNPVSPSLYVYKPYYENNRVIASSNGTLFLSGQERFTNFQTELLKIIPGEDKPVLVKDINGETESKPENLVDVSGTLFFTAREENDRTLWKSDGTASGTVRVKDINVSNNGNTYFRDFTAANNKVFFVANDGQHGEELWVSDGTESGTHLVKDINPSTYPWGDPAGSSIRHMTSLQDVVFFQASVDERNYELWKSDGTEQGTVKLTTFNANPANLVVVKDHLFFVGHDNNDEAAIWKSDGTIDGTVMVKNVSKQNYEVYENLTDGNGILYFVVEDYVHGRELWKSDGTAEGTVLVKDIHPNGSSHPSNLYYTNSRLYFSADDGVHGQELWVTDGTSQGTTLVGDIYTGSLDSYPTNMIALGGQLIFNATTELGNELWAYDLPFSLPLSADKSIATIEDSLLTFQSSDFPFTSFSNKSLIKVKITEATTKGQFFLDDNSNLVADEGELIKDGDEIDASDLSKITFVPKANGYGNTYDSFRFKVYDGEYYSDRANTLAFDILPVADQPTVTNATATVGNINREGLIINVNKEDGAEVAFFKITSIENGALYLSDGTTVVQEGSFISSEQGALGLKFRPASSESGGFTVQASLTDTDEGLGGQTATATVTVVDESTITSTEESVQHALTAYPNPTQDRVILRVTDPRWQQAEVVITNTTGSSLVRTTVNESVLPVDLSTYPAGLYLVTIRKGSQVRNLKIIKK